MVDNTKNVLDIDMNLIASQYNFIANISQHKTKEFLLEYLQQMNSKA
jgi:hypothetical protein